DAAGANGFLRQSWPKMRGSYLLSNQNLRAKLLEVRARCALALPGSRYTLEAEKITARLEQEQEAYMEGPALLLRANLAIRRAQQEKAQELLAKAARLCDKWEMRDHAASARYALGERPGDWFEEQKIANPAAWVRMRFAGNPQQRG